MHIYSFEKLTLWNEIRKLIKDIYKLTSDFPDHEKFGLSNQMRRAIVSVSSNIAEGSSRTSYKDQARFSQIAYSSLMEIISQVTVAFDLEYIDKRKYELTREDIDKIAPRIAALRNSQLKHSTH